MFRAAINKLVRGILDTSSDVFYEEVFNLHFDIYHLPTNMIDETNLGEYSEL